MLSNGTSILLVGKSAYSYRYGDVAIPTVLAGHTVQLIRGLVEYLRDIRISYIFPASAGVRDITFWDAEDTLPPNLDPLPIGIANHGKIGFHLDAIELCSQIREAVNCSRPVAAVFVYPFPMLSASWRLLRDLNIPVLALLRGGDAYKWLDQEYVENHLGSTARAARLEYVEALRSCAAVFAASSWLRDVAEKHVVPCTGVVPSPPPVLRGHSQAPILNRKREKYELLKQLGTHWIDTPPDPNRHWLLWSGRIHADKRLDLAIEAFTRAKLRDWQMIIAGSGDKDLCPEASDRRFARLLVPPRLLPALYCSVDAMIHTSLASGDFMDARPSSVTSATAYGVPAIIIYDRNRGGAHESVSSAVLRVLGVEAGPEMPETQVIAKLASRLQTLEDNERLQYLSHTCDSVDTHVASTIGVIARTLTHISMKGVTND